MNNRFWVFVLMFFLAANGFAQNPEINRIDPPFWWNNLNNKKLQLCVYGKNVAAFKIEVKAAGVVVDSIEKVENKNFVFINLDLKKFTGNQILINFFYNGKARLVKYKLESLTKNTDNISPKDFVYLVFPDRFSNGDTTNDKFNSLNENWYSRDSAGGRHGGDLQGIINHVDYFKNLGVTTLWLNPTLENNQPSYSYHGYSLTDHYNTDPRLGSNQTYKKLGDELKKRNMKLMMDLVPNHVGSKHWMFLDQPEKNWYNQWPAYTNTNYRATVHFDPHASTLDKKKMTDGWFVPTMPDVNQNNPRHAMYLMQSYLWWINYAGIAGFRIDTYSYNDVDFMNKCLKYIQTDYPNFYSTGEIWEQAGVLQMAAFTKNNNFAKSNKENQLTSAKDFHLYWSILEALNQKSEWDKGLAKIYYTLAHDGLYADANLNLTFLDNHDVNRFYTEIKEDFAKWKIGMGLLLTMRGIPSIYYGTEVLATNAMPRKNDGQIREDFPGGWPKDKVNKFIESNKTAQENEAFNFIKQLAKLRSDNEVLQTGELMQFTPEGNTYVYFRYNNAKTFMVCVNRGETMVNLATIRFEERMLGFDHGINWVTYNKIDNLSSIKLEPNSIAIIELKKIL